MILSNSCRGDHHQNPQPCPEALKDKIIASTAENVSLIKSIPLQFHQRIESVALRSISQGGEGAKDAIRGN